MSKKQFVLPLICAASLLTSCGSSGSTTAVTPAVSSAKPVVTATSTPAATPSPSPSPSPKVDPAAIKANENGKMMVVMFHNFIETYTSGDKEYTTTLTDFRQLLETLYTKGYRLISMSDFISNRINVPAGTMPMIFTFDDGTSGQFKLMEKDGKMIADPKTAVGIMEEFATKHPDFGLKGSLYVNLGLRAFDGPGTPAQRLQYLKDKGFEIGNHTLTHIDLSKAANADALVKEVGGNQKKMNDILPGYQFTSMALPFGSHAPKGLEGSLAEGNYQGTAYRNQVLLEVGAGPTLAPNNKRSAPLSMSRVRASGITKVDNDLSWWLAHISHSEEYISDGNPETVSVPKSKAGEVDEQRLKGAKLITY